MAKIEAIVDELLREAKTTRRLLERIPTEHLAWQPHERSRSIGALAWHLVIIPPRIARFAQTDEADALSVPPPPAPETTGEMLEAFDGNLREAAELLGRIDDEAFGRLFTFRRGDLLIFKLPKGAYLRTVLLNHSVHHRGQLSVYLRLLGIPVPTIYGPSADESPAGR